MTPAQAREMVSQALFDVAPDAQLDQIASDTDLRTAFELDSMDFQSFMAGLSQRSGVSIDEEDYRRLATIAGCVEFLTSANASK